MANSGDGWRSPAFDLFDKSHPAVTGQHHPDAVRGAGSGNHNTSAIAAARGEISQTTPQHGQHGQGNLTSAASGYPTQGMNAQSLQGGVPASQYPTQGTNLGSGYGSPGYATQATTAGDKYPANVNAAHGQGYATQGSATAQAYQQGAHDAIRRQ